MLILKIKINSSPKAHKHDFINMSLKTGKNFFMVLSHDRGYSQGEVGRAGGGLEEYDWDAGSSLSFFSCC
jgi:hypothetical protein